MRRLKAKGSPFYAAGAVGGADIAVGPELTNKITCQVQLTDSNGYNCEGCRMVSAYLSDTEGGKLCATQPSGGWSVGVKGNMVSLLIGKYSQFISELDGTFDIEVTEAAAKTFHLVFVFPSGETMSTPLVFA